MKTVCVLIIFLVSITKGIIKGDERETFTVYRTYSQDLIREKKKEVKNRDSILLDIRDLVIPLYNIDDLFSCSTDSLRNSDSIVYFKRIQYFIRRSRHTQYYYVILEMKPKHGYISIDIVNEVRHHLEERYEITEEKDPELFKFLRETTKSLPSISPRVGMRQIPYDCIPTPL